jgi:peroxiredoxin
MLKRMMGFLLIPLLLWASPLRASEKGVIPQKGDVMPPIVLPVPQDAAHQTYLGVTSGSSTFQITDIKGAVLIIEIMSMYCPHCQREAPRINTFFNSIEQDAVLKDKVKLIGIGAGNSLFEINFFKKKYAVPFPLFPDAEFQIHKQIGEVRTPYFFGVHLKGPEAGRIFYSQLGGPDDALKFLENLLQKAGLK